MSYAKVLCATLLGVGGQPAQAGGRDQGQGIQTQLHQGFLQGNKTGGGMYHTNGGRRSRRDEDARPYFAAPRWRLTTCSI